MRWAYSSRAVAIAVIAICLLSAITPVAARMGMGMMGGQVPGAATGPGMGMPGYYDSGQVDTIARTGAIGPGIGTPVSMGSGTGFIGPGMGMTGYGTVPNAYGSGMGMTGSGSGMCMGMMGSGMGMVGYGADPDSYGPGVGMMGSGSGMGMMGSGMGMAGYGADPDSYGPGVGMMGSGSGMGMMGSGMGMAGYGADPDAYGPGMGMMGSGSSMGTGMMGPGMGMAGYASDPDAYGPGMGMGMMGSGSGMGMGMMGQGGYAGLVDPPSDGPFRDPVPAVDTNPDPDIVEVSLEAKVVPVTVGGITANLMTYNGLYPGPLIRAKRGDIVRVHFRNSLPATPVNILGHAGGMTNIHTHGWHVSPQPPSDDVHIVVNPGSTYDYEYNLSLQYPGTLTWYHPHIHALTASQVGGGLAGVSVIADPTDALSAYETHILVVRDLVLAGSEPPPYASMMEYMMGREGNILTVNGQVNPVLDIKPGQVQRWRIVNAANARFFRLAVPNLTMNIIGTDGGLLDKPYPIPEIILSPGERVDLLVQASQNPGTSRLLALPYNRGCMMMGSGSGQARTMMTLNSAGTPSSDTIPASINPGAARVAMDTASLPHKSFILSMGMGEGYINGQNFDRNPLMVTSTLGTWEVWDISNPTMMDHPFHQHLNAAQVLSIQGGNPGYASLYTRTPAWKDTVIVPRGGRVSILVPVMDYPGMVMYHCHILEHEDIGMMGMWDIEPPAGEGAPVDMETNME